MVVELTTPFILLAAPFVGSFLGLLVLRLPAGEFIVFDRSRCPHCRSVLSPLDLVPLISWLVSRGACRHCGAKLGVFYPAIEIAAIVVALCVLVVVPQEETAAIVFSLMLGWALLALAWIDVHHFLLPDALTVPLIGTGLLAAWFLAPDEMLDHVIGALIGYGIFRLVAEIYRRVRGRDGLGGGDAKLMAAAGAWLSWEGLPSVLLVASLAALVVHVIAAAVERRRQVSLHDKLPFGPALAAAIWLVWLSGPFVVTY